MIKPYRIIAHLISGCVVLQATWIALANFLLIHDVDGGTVVDKSYDGNTGDVLHAIFGMGIIPLLALTLLIMSFFIHVPGAVQRAGFVVLAVVLQITFAFIAFGVPIIGVLHGVNAFVIIGTAEFAASRVSARPMTGAATAPV